MQRLRYRSWTRQRKTRLRETVTAKKRSNDRVLNPPDLSESHRRRVGHDVPIQFCFALVADIALHCNSFVALLQLSGFLLPPPPPSFSSSSRHASFLCLLLYSSGVVPIPVIYEYAAWGEYNKLDTAAVTATAATFVFASNFHPRFALSLPLSSCNVSRGCNHSHDRGQSCTTTKESGGRVRVSLRRATQERGPYRKWLLPPSTRRPFGKRNGVSGDRDPSA